MNKANKNGDSEDELASRDEIDAAINALSTAQVHRLEGLARIQINKIGSAAKGRSEEDLLQESLELVLSGQRGWKKKKVDFVGLLAGIIRSLASHWAEALSASEVTENWLPSSGADQESPINMAANPGASPEERFVVADELKRVLELFSDDEKVLLVIESWREELRGPEIMEMLGLTDQEYNTICRRIRRKVLAVRNIGDDNE